MLYSPYMVVLPLSTTDAGCGTLHFTLTVIINSSSNSSHYKEVNRHASVLDKSKKFAAGTFRDDITTPNSSNNCKKQPVPVQSLSTSVNIATQLPDSLTNQDNANSKLRSFNFTDCADCFYSYQEIHSWYWSRYGAS